MNLDSVLTFVEMGLGAYGVGWVNDTYAAPFVEGLVPALQADHTLSKVTDTATCAGTAIGAGKIFKLLTSGGLILAAMKGISIAVPGSEVKTTVPSPLSLFRSTLGQTGAKAAAPGVPGVAGAPMVTGGTSNTPALAPAGSSGSFGMSSSGNFLNVPAPPAANLDWGA